MQVIYRVRLFVWVGRSCNIVVDNMIVKYRGAFCKGFHFQLVELTDILIDS